MKREREGGGKDQAGKEWGARSGQDTLSPTRFLRPQRRRPTKVRRSARQGHLPGSDSGEPGLGRSGGTKLLPTVTFILRGVIYCASLDLCTVCLQIYNREL